MVRIWKLLNRGDIMRLVVDRIEGNYAVLESNEDYIDVELNKIGLEVKEGDILEYKNGIYTRLEEETKNRQDYIEDLFDSIFKDQD